MMLHAVCYGEEAGARNRAFFHVKWLQPAMESYFVCAAVAAGVVWFLVCVLQQCLCLCA